MLDSVVAALPDVGTLPPPGDKVTEVAPEVLHVRSEVPAPPRLEGLAENEMITGGVAAAATVTVTVLVTLPAVLDAVSVYVVVTTGVAAALPEDGT